MVLIAERSAMNTRACAARRAFWIGLLQRDRDLRVKSRRADTVMIAPTNAGVVDQLSRIAALRLLRTTGWSVTITVVPGAMLS